MNRQAGGGNQTLAPSNIGMTLGQIARFELLGDARSFAVIRAFQLGVFQSAPTVFEDEFTAPPGTSPSKWLNPIETLGTSSQLSGERGGVIRLSTNGTLNAVESWNLGQPGPVPGLISDPGVDGSHWYVLWIFRIPTAVDNHNTATLNIRPTSTGTNELFFGVDGQFESTTVLVGEENVLNATLSDVPIAPGTWHYLEAYQFGVANEIHFGFDGESPKLLTMTAPFGHSASLALVVGNGATLAVKSLDSDHVVLLMDNNVQLAIP